MPDVSSYISVNNKEENQFNVEVNEPKPKCICWKGLILYGMFSLAWLAGAALLYYMNTDVSYAITKCDHQGLERVWEHYKAAHGKNYSQEEEEKRICIFLENKKAVDSHNLRFSKGLEPYEKGLNQFSDLPMEDLDAIRSFSEDIDERRPLTNFSTHPNPSYPDSFDWRDIGQGDVVSGVKDQGMSCGSSYAFSATGALEGNLWLAYGGKVSLSEQNLVDCSKSRGNKGCRGGTMNNAFRYVLENEGLNTEPSYPYEEREGPCRFRRSDAAVKIHGYWAMVPTEAALRGAVAGLGPISAAIHATNNFFAYKRGIFEDASCNASSLNHAVLVIGYGSEGGRDFWLVKNSFGTGWGERGFFRIARNKGNMCGIASLASWPLVELKDRVKS